MVSSSLLQLKKGKFQINILFKKNRNTFCFLVIFKTSFLELFYGFFKKLIIQKMIKYKTQNIKFILKKYKTD